MESCRPDGEGEVPPGGAPAPPEEERPDGPLHQLLLGVSTADLLLEPAGDMRHGTLGEEPRGTEGNPEEPRGTQRNPEEPRQDGRKEGAVSLDVQGENVL